MCRTLKSVPGCSFYFEGEMAMCAIIYQFMSCDQISKFAGILSAALSQYHLLSFEIAQLEFYHMH